MIALSAIVSYAVFGLKRAHQLRHARGFSKGGVLANLACALVAFAAFALCLFGVPVGRAAALYLLGLMGLLGSSIVMFWHVIASILRPHDN